MNTPLSPTVTPELSSIHEEESSWPLRLVSLIVFLNGLFAILEILYNRFPSRLELLLPINYELYSRSAGLFAGFLLIYFSSQLLQGKRLAWWMTFIASTIVILGHALYGRELMAFILPAITLVLLAVYEHHFVARSEFSNIAQGVRLLVISLVVAVLYGTIGFVLLSPRDFGHHFTVNESFTRTIREYTLIGNDDLRPHTHYAQWFLDSLDLLGVVSITFAAYSLFRPLAYRFATLPHDRERARGLLERYATSSDDYFKLWPEDKSYFFLAGGSSFITYRVVRGVALCLGDPTGPEAEQLEILRAFVAHCRVYGWSVALLYLSTAGAALCDELGMRSFKIGEEAVVDLATFNTETVRNKHFRAVTNKFQRNGYAVERLDPPLQSEIMRQLGVVSRSWLRQPGRTERGFALGYFERNYIRQSTVYALKDNEGRIMAFANQIPSFLKGEASIDLMRHHDAAETGAMDYLFSQMFSQLAESGYTSFNLGLAPFSGMEEAPGKTVEEHVIDRLYRSDLRIFAFRGLRRYKEKFDPTWHERYVSYQGSPATLARVGAAFTKAVKLD